MLDCGARSPVAAAAAFPRRAATALAAAPAAPSARTLRAGTLSCSRQQLPMVSPAAHPVVVSLEQSEPLAVTQRALLVCATRPGALQATGKPGSAPLCAPLSSSRSKPPRVHMTRRASIGQQQEAGAVVMHTGFWRQVCVLQAAYRSACNVLLVTVTGTGSVCADVVVSLPGAAAPGWQSLAHRPPAPRSSRAHYAQQRSQQAIWGTQCERCLDTGMPGAGYGHARSITVTVTFQTVLADSPWLPPGSSEAPAPTPVLPGAPAAAAAALRARMSAAALLGLAA
jgi:hypothetical protein